jgi:hypothetical protein
VTLSRERTDLSTADFAGRSGRVSLVGTLVLDYVPVRCEAVIDLPALTGKGRLVVES